VLYVFRMGMNVSLFFQCCRMNWKPVEARDVACNMWDFYSERDFFTELTKSDVCRGVMTFDPAILLSWP